MSKKVYCRNCKYLNVYTNFYTGDIISYFCCPATKRRDNWYSHSSKSQTIFDPKDQNYKNDCTYYKRKWWKVWIK